ncbi:RimK family alpha-L-glutamate ligase [Kitasatospora aureofaciens]|uniref:ATP-grasp domain-containing protein n=1 Tax=Kitasatospora aureofaciens TaxID=1894 RepID=UPI001C4737B7|nr:ATP-grasp domain-containing protein [Kitasatospora aureofaciens]MBV6696728.1 ATP-grasp domain-containing protein [Kitasatospora aureofaciens]
MIIVCGIASESPIARVTAALDQLGSPYTVLHQRRFLELPFELEVTGTGIRGRLMENGRAVDCATVTGIYTRLMDWRGLPEVRAASEDTVRRCQSWHEALGTWIELAQGCVMNRVAATASNLSKPHQAQLIRRTGFRVPETLVTNDPELVHDFRARHGELVYKSISGIRSIVRFLDQDAIDRLSLIRSCPVQFQRFIAGTNIRVHTVAGEVFATRIETDRVDYRYAHRDGGRAELSAWQPPDDLAARCLLLAEQLGLTLAGIDLLLADDGEVYCFEVNPSPAFSYFESCTDQPIARAIALALR